LSVAVIDNRTKKYILYKKSRVDILAYVGDHLHARSVTDIKGFQKYFRTPKKLQNFTTIVRELCILGDLYEFQQHEQFVFEMIGLHLFHVRSN